MTAARIICLAGLVVLICPSSPAAEPEGGNPCYITPGQTVDDGMGAEPGVVREFVNGISIPPECLRGGRVWVPRIRIGVTRTAGGAPDMEVRVSIRAPQPPGLGPNPPPGNFRTPPTTHTLTNVPFFPAVGDNLVHIEGDNNQNLNNILWGDYFYPSVDMNGNNTQNQFVVADEMGPIDQNCYTGVNGETPLDLCTNGNADLSDPWVGVDTATFYGRYSGQFPAAVDGREPLGTVWGARYIGAFGATSFAVWHDASVPLGAPEGEELICEFFDIPADFEFQCTMTVPQLAALAAGGIFVELTQGASVRRTSMIPADIFIFADGFESGDTSVW